ncbi:tyrosine-type recombinase/integrase [Croceicoccus mobilis]|uniref:Integrase n=1 Tax=Croceicoccus mobilis TaxID=1703339 RepID=A0A916YSA4_9SPHN|nr:site-specific integrase [Croceicoccus mobilis]GGD58629.1 integrase [Croceicoccus mobilis]
MAKLTDMKVKKAGPGVHGDGAGLYLRVKPSGAKSWVLRVQHMGRREDIGLGGYPADLSLAEAREKAAHLRKLARQGHDARAERDKGKVRVPTFAEAMKAAHEELGKGWSEKTAAAFKSSLSQHVAPRIGSKRIDCIHSDQIIAALAPIWTEKPAIAKKVRVRIMQVLQFAKAKRWRTDPLPTPKDISSGLAKQSGGSHFAAMPFAQVPEFIAEQLLKEETPGRMALLFTILTAARSGEVRNARWEHISLEDRTWTRPKELMKMKSGHAVTLSDAAIALLERAAALFGTDGLIFPGAARGKPLSDMTLTRVMRLAGEEVTVHGFRSAFRDWAAERMPTIPAMVAEMALAHKVGTATEQAYLRTDLRDMRRSLMDGWGRFVAPSLSAGGNNIVDMAGRQEVAA